VGFIRVLKDRTSRRGGLINRRAVTTTTPGFTAPSSRNSASQIRKKRRRRELRGASDAVTSSRIDDPTASWSNTAKCLGETAHRLMET